MQSKCRIKWHVASQTAQAVKYVPAKQETQVQAQSWEDPLEEEMAAHSSILAWNIPWTGEPGELQLMGSQRVGHNWVTEHARIENTDKNIKEDSNPHNPIILDKVSSCYFCFSCLAVHWRNKWQPTPVFLPGEFHGQRSLVGYSPWGHKGTWIRN